MRALYSLILYLMTPLVVLRLLWRGLRARGYWERWPERFGWPARPARPGAVWIHAVSVGEAQAAAPMIRALRERHPQLPILVTTTTPTGAARVVALFGDRVEHRYAPYDLPGVVRRYLGRVEPRLLVVMETELWPNLFHHCHQRGVPVVVANARLSVRSARGYARIGHFTRRVLADVSLIAAQGRADAARFHALGADEGRLRVTGTIKFDARVPPSLHEQAEVTRRELGVDRPVWIAASTHEGEEAAVLEAFERVLETVPDALLVLVPRHPERFARVEQLARQRFVTVTRSSGEPCAAETRVYLGDTMGELPMLFAAADLAFVGGSLVEVGGHNVLEPAAVGVPVLFGPHMHNFAQVSQQLLEAGGARRVADREALAEWVVLWLQDANARHAAGERGAHMVAANRGALEALLGLLDGVLAGEGERPVAGG
ncbi:lipid IV(A) 3-deoxy-D-manno-octulosonic acid transferase [Endothiovibrio diazotrophicus]